MPQILKQCRDFLLEWWPDKDSTYLSDHSGMKCVNNAFSCVMVALFGSGATLGTLGEKTMCHGL